MFERIAIIGVGLIGGSFALAIKERGLCRHVAGFGRNTGNLMRAKERGIIDSVSADPADACIDADLVMLSAPVGSFPALAKIIAPVLRAGSVVTDAGSVKGALVTAIEKAMPAGVQYIGAHPIAGSERSGIDSARPDLFAGAKCIVTPTESSDRQALEKVIRLWESLGSTVISMDPSEHDRIYAAVSHLPHILAYVLVNTVAEGNITDLDFSGKGFRDLTRIAASSPDLWTDICVLNREKLRDALSAFRKNLDTIDQFLAAADSASLRREFEKAQARREGIGQG